MYASRQAGSHTGGTQVGRGLDCLLAVYMLLVPFCLVFRWLILASVLYFSVLVRSACLAAGCDACDGCLLACSMLYYRLLLSRGESRRVERFSLLFTTTHCFIYYRTSSKVVINKNRNNSKEPTYTTMS